MHRTQLHATAPLIGCCSEKRMFYANKKTKRLPSLSFNNFVDAKNMKRLKQNCFATRFSFSRIKGIHLSSLFNPPHLPYSFSLALSERKSFLPENLKYLSFVLSDNSRRFQLGQKWSSTMADGRQRNSSEEVIINWSKKWCQVYCKQVQKGTWSWDQPTWNSCNTRTARANGTQR